MMIYTINSKPFPNPCPECRYKGNIRVTDSLCLVCGMTPLEKRQWPLLSDPERVEKGAELVERVETMWMIWEVMEEPTIQ
jgi:hypothetical protein